RPAEAHLAQRLGQQLREGVLVLVRHAGEGGVEAKTGVDADDQQVQRVRQAFLDLRPTSIDLLLQPKNLRVVAEDGAAGKRDDEVDDVAEKQAEQDAEGGE